MVFDLKMGVLPKSEVLFAIENIGEQIIWWSRLVFDTLLWYNGKQILTISLKRTLRDILDTTRIHICILK